MNQQFVNFADLQQLSFQIFFILRELFEFNYFVYRLNNVSLITS